jgi:monoamine oxidase
MIYDVIILGGGIAGLYTAYKLQQTNPKLKLLLLEKNNYFGGRIYTVHHKDLVFEAGAGRFNETHERLHTLIDELGLKSKITPIPSELCFVPSGPYPAKYFGKDPFQVMTPVLQKARETSRHQLRQWKFMEFARKILSTEDSKFLEDSFGYHEQLMEMNTFDAVKLFDKGMHTKHDFFVLQGGMSQIIDTLVSKLGSSICKKSMSVSQITYDSTTKQFEISAPRASTTQSNQPTQSHTTYQAYQCVAALPRPALESIPFFKPIKSITRTIGCKTLCRIYAQFDKRNIWFKHVPKSTTNNQLRYVIPIDRDKGLIMISYTDGKYARYWKDKDETAMIKRLKAYIYQTFDFEIASPIYTKKCYWPLGTAYWKPNVKSYEVARKMIQPMDCPLYICGENYSTNQGWIEGALETSDVVLHKMSQS